MARKLDRIGGAPRRGGQQTGNARVHGDMARPGDQRVKEVPLGKTASDAPPRPPAPAPGQRPPQRGTPQQPPRPPAPTPGQKPQQQVAPTPGMKPAQQAAPKPGQKPAAAMPNDRNQTTASAQMPDAPPPRPPQPPAQKGARRLTAAEAEPTQVAAGQMPTPPGTKPAQAPSEDEMQIDALEGIKDRILNEPGFADRMLQHATPEQKQKLRANLDPNTAVGRTVLDALDGEQPNLARGGFAQIEGEWEFN